MNPDNVQLEIAHVLFIDIVGYSKLLTNEQRERLQELNRIVRETEQFRAAEANDKLVRIPTGDGMVLALLHQPGRLRKNPRFQKIIAGPEPKTVY